MYKENARLTIILTGIFLSQLYVISSWYGWAGNVAFGPRFWVAQTVVFALGLAALIKAGRTHTILWTAAGSVFVAWNLLLLVQYALQMIPRRGPVDLGLMVRNQFMAIPENLPRILQTIINRGR